MWACGGVYEGSRLMREDTLALMRTNQLSDAALAEFQTENGGYNAGYGYGYGVRTLMGRCPGEACGHMGVLWMDRRTRHLVRGGSRKPCFHCLYA